MKQAQRLITLNKYRSTNISYRWRRDDGGVSVLDLKYGLLIQQTSLVEPYLQT